MLTIDEFEGRIAATGDTYQYKDILIGKMSLAFQKTHT